MHFSKILEDDEEYNIIECTKLDNNILIYKQNLDKNAHNLVKLKNNQYAILFEKGKILDLINEEGVYTIIDVPNTFYSQELTDYQIKKNNESLCVIFFNMQVISNNKFYIKKKHKNDFFGEGEFQFRIDNPIKLFNKVIEIRTFYSREELLEKIRERISKITISVIKEHRNEYTFDETVIRNNIDVFKDYGIKIVSCNIENIEFKNFRKRY